jgi:hypothetical protein
MLSILKITLMGMFQALLTEAFLKEMIIFFMGKLVEKTDNSLDDKIFKRVKKALGHEDEEEDKK